MYFHPEDRTTIAKEKHEKQNKKGMRRSIFIKDMVVQTFGICWIILERSIDKLINADIYLRTNSGNQMAVSCFANIASILKLEFWRDKRRSCLFVRCCQGCRLRLGVILRGTPTGGHRRKLRDFFNFIVVIFLVIGFSPPSE